MRKPDPTRFTGKKGKKSEILEMKGFSIPSSKEVSAIGEKKSDVKKTYKSTEVRVYDKESEGEFDTLSISLKISCDPFILFN